MYRRQGIKLAIISAACLIFSNCVQAGQVIYVDDDAIGYNDGSSWENAFVNLQDAMSAAFSSTESYPAQIRVAGGTYWPDRGEHQTIGQRQESFWLRNYVTIAGGYAGLGAIDQNSRDIELYETILSGDLSNNDKEIDDEGYQLSLRDNSYHVIFGSGVDETAVLDGLTITAGFADGSGEDNHSLYGAGLYNSAASPTIVHCTFIGNNATQGGGLHNENVSCPALIDCTFIGNIVDSSGGGISNREESSPILINCKFTENHGTNGGAMCNISSSNPDLINCIFLRNHAKANGGAIYNSVSFPQISECTFSENVAGEKDNSKGGAICNYDSNPVIRNCLFTGNSAKGLVDAKGGALYNSGGLPIIGNSTFCGNLAFLGGAIYNYGSDPNINSCIFRDNNNSQFAGAGMPVVRYSNIQGGFSGQGNIQNDPRFANPGFWTDLNNPNIIITDPTIDDRVWNEGDYHLLSQNGRWDPETKSWLMDDVTSPCIDTGDPNLDYSEELWPHGKRINMGVYGGTTQAGMSRSYAGDIRDLDNNNSVTWGDVLRLEDKWHFYDMPLKEDMNHDGRVDLNDLVFFANNWEKNSINKVPVLLPVENQYASVGVPLSLSISASDADNDALIYFAPGLPEGASFSERQFTWTADHQGIHALTFVVTDNKSLDYITVQIFVNVE